MDSIMIAVAIGGILVGGVLVFAVWNFLLGRSYKNEMAKAEKATS
jgi:hypothetical protein